MTALKEMQIEASYYWQEYDKMNCSDEFIRGVCSGVEYICKNYQVLPLIEISEETRLALIAMAENFIEAEKEAYREVFGKEPNVE